MELVGGIVGLALLGFWIDRHFETSPWGTLICVVLGLVGGLYNLVRSSFQAFSVKDEQDESATRGFADKGDRAEKDDERRG